MNKTVSFAVMHFSIAFGVAYLITGSLIVGGAVAVIEPAVNTVGYYFHERIWARVTASGEDVSRLRFGYTCQGATG